MKNLWLILVAVSIVSCGPDHTPANDQSNKAIKTWQGTINGKIPVFLWFTISKADSMVFGELIYTNTKLREPIYVVGHLDTALTLGEYSRDGKSTGYWVGKIAAGKIKGTWSSMKSDKEIPFELSSTDTTVNTEVADFTNTGNIDGTYNYSHPCEASGEVNIKRLGKDKLIFNVSCVTCAPAYNIAELNDDTVLIKNNTATYTSRDETGICSFTIRFYKQFLTIGYDCDTCSQCGFGLNAYVGGIFIKTSSKPTMGQDIH